MLNRKAHRGRDPRQAQHYDTVGAALMWTLEQGLGLAFTDDVKTPQATAYGTLAGVMKEAAYVPAWALVESASPLRVACSGVFFWRGWGCGKSHIRMTALSQDASFRLINAAVRNSAMAAGGF